MATTPALSTTTRKAQAPITADSREIIRACSALCPHEYTELRALHCSGNVPGLGTCKDAAITGYFDDWRKLAQWADTISQIARGVYIVLNPFDPALLARCYNRVKIGGDVTKDHDILKRIWLPVDFDPKRAAGVSATEEEKQAAYAVMLFARKWLGETLPDVGQPQLVGDSGNGYHLLYRVDLPPNDGGVIQNILTTLARVCLEYQGGNERVSVDTSNYNPARIWKLYGTAARKGDDFKGNRLGHAPRPWRNSRILELCGEVLQ